MPLALRTDAIIAAPPNVANGCEKSILGWCPIFEPSKTHSAGDYLQNRYNIVRPKLNHQLGQARPDQTRLERTTYIAVLWETTLSSGWQRLKPWLIVLKVELAGRAVVAVVMYPGSSGKCTTGRVMWPFVDAFVQPSDPGSSGESGCCCMLWNQICCFNGCSIIGSKFNKRAVCHPFSWMLELSVEFR